MPTRVKLLLSIMDENTKAHHLCVETVLHLPSKRAETRFDIFSPPSGDEGEFSRLACKSALFLLRRMTSEIEMRALKASTPPCTESR